jgi:glutaredoxin
LGAGSITISEQIPASRKLGADAAADLLASADRLIVAKGKKVVEVDLGDREAAVAAMLGPTGNLRAPTLVIGRTVVVGFHDDAYAEALGTG